MIYKKMSDDEFIRVVNAATFIADGRQLHIKVYKRLLEIIEKRSK